MAVQAPVTTDVRCGSDADCASTELCVASRRVALRGAYADLIECRQFSSLSIDGT